MPTFRFWYYGAYVDVAAPNAEAAKADIRGLATISNGKQFACVPIVSEPEELPE